MNNKYNKNINKIDRMDKYRHNAKILLELYKKVDFHVNDRINSMDQHLYETKRQHLQDVVLSILEVDTSVEIEKIEEQL